MDVVIRKKHKGAWELLKAEKPQQGKLIATVRGVKEAEAMPTLNLVQMAVNLVPAGNGKHDAVPVEKAFGTEKVATISRLSDMKRLFGYLKINEDGGSLIELEAEYEKLSERIASAASDGEFYRLLSEREAISLKIYMRDKEPKAGNDTVALPYGMLG